MSANTSTTDSGAFRDERQEEYTEMLEQLEAAADACLYKIDGEGRIKDAKKEQARSKWINSLVRVVKERREVLKARRLEELADDVEQLKADREDL